jgi:hypothetical protein
MRDIFALTQHMGYFVYSVTAEKFGVSGDFSGVSGHGISAECPESGPE